MTDEARQDALWVASKALKKDRSWIIAHDREPVGWLARMKLERLLGRRLAHEPLAYILQSAPFYGRDFYVDSRVLIPRLETEDLVSAALEAMRGIKQPLVLDIGTGSGIIAATIACENLDANIIASDLDEEAISVAYRNIERLAKGRISLVHASLFGPALRAAAKHMTGDRVFILANLPYLPSKDRETLAPSVARFEPEQALYADDEGLSLNRRLLDDLAAWTTEDARPWTALLEFDPPQSETLAKEAKKLFPKASVEILKDRCGRDRILKIKSPQTPDRPS